MSRLRVFLTIHDSMHFCPTGISFADVMYFTFAIVRAFPRYMLVEDARIASERFVGFAVTYRATAAACVTRPKAYEQLIIHTLNFLNVG